MKFTLEQQQYLMHNILNLLNLPYAVLDDRLINRQLFQEERYYQDAITELKKIQEFLIKLEVEEKQ